MLGLSGWALLVWRRQHKGPEFVRLGRNTIRYPKREFDAWLASLPRN
jgi:predicted DNA-binding transcriptional regulator AlpA